MSACRGSQDELSDRHVSRASSSPCQKTRMGVSLTALPTFLFGVVKANLLFLCRCNLPLFSVRLNEMTPGLEGKLPPTDVRRRGDLRALERGDYTQVTTPLMR